MYEKLQNVVRDKEARRYIEQMDEDGNVYLVEADDPEYDYMDDEDDDDERDDFDNRRPAVMMDPDSDAQQYIDDEEYLEMMEQDAIRRQGGAQGDLLQQ